MSRRRVFQTVLIVVSLSCGPGPLFSQDSLIFVDDGPARAQQAQKAMQDLVAKRFPSPSDIGEHWRKPWELSPAPQRVQSRYWQSALAKRMDWAQFYGMGKPQIEASARAALDKILQAAASGPVPEGTPPELVKMFRSPQGLLALGMVKLRTLNLIAMESELGAAAKVQATLQQYLRERIEMTERQDEERSASPDDEELEKRHAQQREAHTVKHGLMMVQALCPEMPEKTAEEAMQAFVDEVWMTRQYGQMTYVYYSPGDLAKAKTERGLVFPAATITVQLSVMAREAIGTRIVDVNEPDIPKFKADLDKTLNDLLATIRIGAEPQLAEMIPGIEWEVKRLKQRRDELDERRSRATDPSSRQRLDEDIERQDEEIEQREQHLKDLQAAMTELKSGRFDTEIRMRPFGDNSWISLLNLRNVPTQVDPYAARLRNGNAVVNVSAKGTMPREWFIQQLDFFLAAMDERTKVYGEEF